MNKDYEKIENPSKHPAHKHMTSDGFVKWYDQKSWGTKKGSLGRPKETTGKIMGFEDFRSSASTVQ